MADIKRLFSTVLLGLGLVFVFFGLSAALGFGVSGVSASAIVISVLLYSGAVWFAPPTQHPPAPVTMPVVFDADRRMVTGPSPGRRVAEQFPEAVREEVDRRCAAALAGAAGRFAGEYLGRTVVFDVLPVRNADGSILYGILVSADDAAAAV